MPAETNSVENDKPFILGLALRLVKEQRIGDSNAPPHGVNDFFLGYPAELGNKMGNAGSSPITPDSIQDGFLG